MRGILHPAISRVNPNTTFAIKELDALSDLPQAA
jgi:hypothetical protein